MPDSRKNDTLLRQWAMLGILPRQGPGLSSAEIRRQLDEAGYPVTKRTVERDLAMLAGNEFLALECDDSDQPYRWRWRRTSHPFFPAMSATEAVSLVLVEKLLRQALPQPVLRDLEPRFAAARQSLEKGHGGAYARWPERFAHVPAGLSQAPAAVDARILETVQRALLRDCKLVITYRSVTTGSTREVELDPGGLVENGGTAYLVAFTRKHRTPALYALHRIETARILKGEAASVPPEFSLQRYLESGAMNFGVGKSIRLRARVSPDLATHIAERPLGPDQILRSRGKHHTLEVTVGDSWNLQFWLLSQGPSITVTAPKELRQRIRNLHAEAAKGYG